VNIAHVQAVLHRVMWVAGTHHPLRATAGFEVERQWRAMPGVVLPAELGDWRLDVESDALLVDRYFDTADLQLHASRSRLRIRTTPAGPIATLKRRVGSGGRLRRRIEIEAPCEADPEQSIPFVAARLLTLDPLHEIGTIRTRRLSRSYRLENRVVEVVRDRVRYDTGADEWRLELEGDPDDVRTVGRLLERRVPGLAAVRRGKVQTMLARRAA
jgi:inorganic triphosphatase YgiF